MKESLLLKQKDESLLQIKDTAASFSIGDLVVYPAHGVGQITGEEMQNVGNQSISVYVISLRSNNMIVRVPKSKVAKGGLRALSDLITMERAMQILSEKPRVAKGMWGKRAKDYEAKIKSGCIIQLAEVIRDLYRREDEPERSYSEKQIYESALYRFIEERSLVTGAAVSVVTMEVIGRLEYR